MRTSIILGVLATAMCVGHSDVRGVALAGPDDLVISLEGDCPGRLSMSWDGATPNEMSALWFSREQGEYRLPVGICGGTTLDLGPHGLHLARVFNSGAEGQGVLSGRVRQAACGGYLQMMVDDGYPCTTSNVVQIPQ